MANKKSSLIIGGAALLVVGGALVVGPLLENYFGGEKDTMNHGNHQVTTSSNDDSLVQKDSDDYMTYAALKGDDYDKRFIADMIIHHEGAVEMAELALKNAQKQEIKNMAQDIIDAQSKEINDMKQWQQQWGYALKPSTDNHAAMGHESGSMNMSEHMNMMMGELRGKNGGDFDKTFIEQMIVHHQGALNMAAPGEENAKHQEIKNLAKAVVEAQSKEITQMQRWQKDWGYRG